MQSKLVFLETKREWGIAFGFLIGIFVLSMAWRFYVFERYSSQDKQTLQARVLHQYQKNNKWVLKLKTDWGLILYTTSKEHLKNLNNQRILIFGKPAPCSFYQSLKSCFFITFSMDLLPKDWRNIFYELIGSQHQEDLIARFYQTLFLASYLPMELRELASKLKIAHLLAISGLHLGILAFVFYGVLGLIYRFFQARYFTYRNRIFDVGLMVNLLLLAYLFLLDFPPSFVRAYVMSVLGFVFVYCHFALLNFAFLFFCVALILALFPDFIFSLAFWFSVFGVLYIFLFFKYFRFEWIDRKWLKALVIAILLNVVLFFNMLPLTHLFFPSFSLLSFLAIPLSIVFAPLFVLVLGLHLVGLGGSLDSALLWALTFDIKEMRIYSPFWFGLLYIFSSLLAIKSRGFYFLVLGMSVVFCGFLVVKAF